MRGKVCILLAMLALLLAMLACGDYNESSPMLDSVLHVTEEGVR